MLLLLATHMAAARVGMCSRESEGLGSASGCGVKINLLALCVCHAEDGVRRELYQPALCMTDSCMRVWTHGFGRCQHAAAPAAACCLINRLE
jgi:hypothetical protein